MNKILFGLALTLAVATAKMSAQRQYLVEYDKLTDNFSYFEETRKNGKMTKTPLRRIEPAVGDQVRVTVSNVNEFLYRTKVIFKSGPEVYENSDQGNALVSALSTFAPGVGVISSLAAGLSGRGAQANSVAEVNLLEKFEELSENINIQLDYNKRYEDVLQLMTDENLPSDSLRKVCAKEIEELIAYSQVDHSQVELVREIQKKTDDKSLSTEFKNDLQSKMNELLPGSYQNISNHTPQKLIALKRLFDETDFKFTAYNTIGYDEMADADNIEGTADIDENTTSFEIILKFEKMDAITPLLKSVNTPVKKDTKEDFIQYFSTSKWRTATGEVRDSSCDGCTPMVLAEGSFRTRVGYSDVSIPIDYTDLFTEKPSGAYGLWKIYDQETGALMSSFQYTPSDNNRSSDYDFDDDDGGSDSPPAGPVETHYRRAHFHLKKPVKPEIAFAFILNQSFQERSQYDVVGFPGDSLKIMSNSVDEIVPSIGIMLDFPLLRDAAIIPSLNVGASMNVLTETDNQKFNLHLGSGFSPRGAKNLSLTAGISLCRSTALKERYTADTWYSDDDIEFEEVSFQQENLFRDIFQTGYYIGFSVKF